MYSFVYLLMRLTSLALERHFYCILSMQTRLVRLISAETKEYIFGRHLCIRSIPNNSRLLEMLHYCYFWVKKGTGEVNMRGARHLRLKLSSAT